MSGPIAHLHWLDGIPGLRPGQEQLSDDDVRGGQRAAGGMLRAWMDESYRAQAPRKLVATLAAR